MHKEEPASTASGLKTGKLSPESLQRLVLGRLGIRRPEVLVHVAFGEDAAAIGVADQAVVLTADPITGAGARAGWYAIHVCCNDLAAMGAEPVGVLATLLFPPGCQETDIAALVEDLDAAARELGVEILGGHTEVAPGLQRPIVSLAGVGLAPRDRLVRSGGARPGHELLLTKAAGLEGTAILAADLAERLGSTLPPDLLDRARAFRAELSVVPEGLLAARLGASALHDPTEGGVLGAVWELSEASARGFELWLDRIPVRAETRAICAALGLDPLKLVSSGAMLIAAERGAALQQGLEAAGIPCAIVGRIVETGRWLIEGDRRAPAAPVLRDELWRVLEA